MAGARLEIRVEREELERWRQAAGGNVSELVRQAVSEHLDRQAGQVDVQAPAISSPSALDELLAAYRPGC